MVENRKLNGKTFSDIGLAPIALGGLTDGVTVLDMCAAYSAFPNGGKYIAPTTYTKVLDSEGNVILEHKAMEYTAMSETTAEQMISMMQGVVTGGTGTSARIPNVRAAGKTGTTSSNNDRWFVGFTPYYTGAVWFGYDQPAPLRGFSPNPAAVAWRKVMTEVHKGLSDKPFLEDEVQGKYNILICKDSGMRATPSCKNLGGKLYEKSKIPTKRCTEHPYSFNENDLEKGGVLTEKDEEIEGIVDMGEEAENPSESTPDVPAVPPEIQPPVNDGGTPAAGEAVEGV